MNLYNSEAFQKEYQTFKTRIATIQDERLRSEAEKLLAQLVNNVRTLDRDHASIFSGQKLPTNVSDNRTKIADIRRQLSKKIGI